MRGSSVRRVVEYQWHRQAREGSRLLRDRCFDSDFGRVGYGGTGNGWRELTCGLSYEEDGEQEQEPGGLRRPARQVGDRIRLELRGWSWWWTTMMLNLLKVRLLELG